LIPDSINSVSTNTKIFTSNNGYYSDKIDAYFLLESSDDNYSIGSALDKQIFTLTKKRPITIVIGL